MLAAISPNREEAIISVLVDTLAKAGVLGDLPGFAVKQLGLFSRLARALPVWTAAPVCRL